MSLNIFISYSHDDVSIATSLSNLLQLAFGPALTEVFVDHASIPFGANIKGTVMGGLKRADILIAVMAGAQPASSLSWPGFEIGTFTAYWEPREKTGLLGSVFVLSNGTLNLGPQAGQRIVNLGISEDYLSASEEDIDECRRAAAVANGEMLHFLKELEKHLLTDPAYIEFSSLRNTTLADLVREFKYDSFNVMRGRVRSRSKPAKQLILRTKGTVLGLCNDSKIFSVSGACEVFGKSENDTKIFTKAHGGSLGVDRYEASWGDFRNSLLTHPYGAYWCAVIEQVVEGATREGTEVDPNLVIISARGQRYRVIATTVTNFYNNESEVSVYVIEALKRCEQGDAVTSNLLNCITIVCRFRFAFLEGKSPFYWRNFERSSASARDLLMELDFLRSEAMNANLEQPGAWEDFLDPEDLSEMVRIWNDVDLSLRNACNSVISTRKPMAPGSIERLEISKLLKRIYDEVDGYNALVGVSISQRILEEFKADRDRRPMRPSNTTGAPS